MLALLAAAAAGCGTRPSPTPVLAENCIPISGRQEVDLDLHSSTSGLLRVVIRQQGISLVGRIITDNGAATRGASSPVERVGVITILAEGQSPRPVTVRIASRDSPDITGNACVSAEIVSYADRGRVRAERAHASAAEAVHARQWQAAFRDYLAAARAFDRLGQREWAAIARHAMAELAYLRFHRERDSYALVSAALADMDQADPAVRGSMLTLQAKALMELPAHYTITGTATIHERLAKSRELFGAAAFGERELPRLSVLEGFLEYQTGDSSGLPQRFAAAAAACRALMDWQCYAEARQNTAALAEEQQDYAVALDAYYDALRSLDAAITPELVADISDNLGRLEGKVGLFGRSERSRKAAMRTYARLGQCSGARRSLSSLGALLAHVGSLTDASAYLGQAVSLSCEELLRAVAGDSANAADGPTGSASAPCANPPALDELSTDGQLAVFQALWSLSDVRLMQGDVRGARRCVSAAQRYAATPRTRVQLANASGTVFLEQNQALFARTEFERALRISDDAELPATYGQRGIAHLGLARSDLLLGRADVVQRSAYEALRMSSMRADVSQIVASLQLLAASFSEADETALAIQTLRSAAGLIEQVPIEGLDGEKRAMYLASQHAVFAELTDLLVREATGDESAAWSAFEVSEQGRARSLRHAISQTQRDTPTGATGSASEDYRHLLERIAALAEGGAGTRWQDHLAKISELGTTASSGRYSLDRERLVQELDRMGAALIEYAVGQHDMFAFVLERGRLRVERLGSRESVARAVNELTRRLRAAEPVPRLIRTAAREVARLVVWPVSRHVTSERILFVPDDALHTVPFAVLPWSEQTPDQLVVHRAETALLPSALLVAAEPRPRSPRHDAVHFELIGDPVFQAREWRSECADRIADSPVAAHPISRSISDWVETLPRLPGTQDEVLGIARLVRQVRPHGRVSTLLRCAATPSALRAAASRGTLVHIATHGRVDAQRPRLSALALTPESATTDHAAFGLLEVLGLDLRSGLVVLSACDTSRGRLLPGEGVLGLAQAFLQVGAASVVASHWRVEDKTTAVFMQRFYEHLLVDRLPAATALRRTQLDRLASDPSYDWAAFSLYGSPDSSL